jgi:hypothetical protein
VRQGREWCSIEFRAIRDIIKQKQHERVMFVRMDDGAVDGVFSIDGYVDARQNTPGKVAEMIGGRC